MENVIGNLAFQAPAAAAVILITIYFIKSMEKRDALFMESMAKRDALFIDAINQVNLRIDAQGATLSRIENHIVSHDSMTREAIDNMRDAVGKPAKRNRNV